MTRALLGLALLAGCVKADKVIVTLTYIQDPRTGMCFATGDAATGGGLAHVPCTESVLKLVRCARLAGDDTWRCQGSDTPVRDEQIDTASSSK